MDILTIVLACSLHFDDELVTALIRKVSNDNALLVGDLVTLTTHDHLTTVGDAKAAVADILKHGGRPAVGLLGVPITWAAHYGRAPDDLFDACTNIAVGTAALSEYADQCTPRHVRGVGQGRGHSVSRRALERQRACVLRRLGDELGATGYADAVLAEIAARHEQPHDDVSDPPPAISPIDAPLDDLRSLARPALPAVPQPPAATTAAPPTGPSAKRTGALSPVPTATPKPSPPFTR